MTIRLPTPALLGLIVLGLAGCGATTSSGGVQGAAIPTPVPSGAVEIKVVANALTTGTYLPADATAKVGQAVAWEFADPSNSHSVTADDGSFDSGVQDLGFVFVHVFTKPGTYTYHCSLHTGMVGRVTVTAP